jgi:isopenicillin-N N-acyltransferase like protein
MMSFIRLCGLSLLICSIFFVCCWVFQPEKPTVTAVPLVSILPEVSACAFVYPQTVYFKGSLRYMNGIAVLTVEGTPREIGEQTALLAVLPSEDAHKYPREMFDKYVPLRGLFKDLAWRRTINTGEALIANFPASYRAEFEEIAKRWNRDTAVAANTLFDIKNDFDIQFGCSTVAILPEKSDTGGLLFGRNLDYPSGGYLHNYTLLIIYKSVGKKSVASLTYPGLVGCVTAMNEDGLCLAVLEVKHLRQGTTKFTVKGCPYAVCYRKLLEECSSVGEVRMLLPNLKVDTANSLAVCDGKIGVVFEMTPDGYVERPANDGICICTNHFCEDRFRPSNERNAESLARMQVMKGNLATKQRAGVKEVHQLLDEVRSYENTIQTVVFEPAQLTMYIGVGVVPSTKAELKKLNLTRMLKQ